MNIFWEETCMVTVTASQGTSDAEVDGLRCILLLYGEHSKPKNTFAHSIQWFTHRAVGDTT